MEIKVLYHVKDLEPIAKKENGDWIDLRVAEDVRLRAGEFTKISLGVSMKLPEGYTALLVPRSSTFEKYGIIQTNSIGIIDNSYSGENDIWMMPVLATRDIEIPKNTRICQFTIQKNILSDLIITEVDHLSDSSRGGFGSTGNI